MATIFTRKARLSDLDSVMAIIDEAKKFIRESGNTQWQEGYPNHQTITDDINSGHSYVLVVDGEIAGTSALIVGEDPAHTRIDHGEWHDTENPYATINRIALASKFRGQHLSDYFLSDLITLAQVQGIHNVRMDTSRKNIPLQKIAERFGFKHRGQTYVDAANDQNDQKRMAFELNLLKLK